MHTSRFLLALATACACSPVIAQIELPPPMSGSYTVDPKGTGDRTFLDLKTAVRFIALVGVTGAIEIKVVPGRYEGALTFFPVLGLKKAQMVVVRAVGEAPVYITAAGSTVSFQEGANHIVLDGLTFGGSGTAPAIVAGTRVADIEIRNCHFTSAAGGNRLIEIQGKRDSRRWNIHHNRFELASKHSAGIYTQATYELRIHHNEFLCNGGREPISIWNANKSESSIHDNVFRGRLGSCALRLDVSGHDVDVRNNIFLIELRNGNDAIIRSSGLRNGVVNRIRHNVFVVRGGGVAVATRGPIRIDHNVYAIQDGGIGKTKNDVQETLKDWQQVIAESYAVKDEADQHSAVAGKRFFDKYGQLIALFHDFEEAGEARGLWAKLTSKRQTRKARPRLEANAEVAYLIRVLGEGDPVAIRLALKRLAAHGRRAIVAVPALGKLCGHSLASIRADAAEALGRIKIGAEIVIPELVKMLDDTDTRVLLAVIQTLGSFEHLATESAPRLTALSKHEVAAVRAAAVAARLAVIGENRRK